MPARVKATGRGSAFGRNVAVLLAGTVLAQAIPISLSPVYTRLFTPEAFGAWSAFTAAAAVLGVVTTGRYELAILLPEQDDEAASVLGLTLILALSIGTVLALAAHGARAGIAELLGAPTLMPWAFLLGLSAAALGIWQALSYWANRRGQYPRIAGSQILQQSGAGVTTLGLGLAMRFPSGLILGTVAGQVVADMALGLQLWREERGWFLGITRRGIWEAARRFYRFPLFNLPYSILTTSSVRIPVLLLTAFGALSAAGFVGFSRMVVYAPITFVSASLGRVYFREASAQFGTPALERLTTGLLSEMTYVGSPAFAFLMVWAPDLFALVFGPTWREAGEFTRLLTPAAFGFLFTSWPERIYEVAQRQSLSLRIQAICDAVTVATVAGLLATGVPVWWAILVYGVLSLGYNMVYLWGVFRVGGFPWKAYQRTLAQAAAGLAAGAAAMILVRWTVPGPLLGMAVSVVLLLLVYGWLWRSRGAEWRGLLRGAVA